VTARARTEPLLSAVDPLPPDAADLREEIARLEARVESLADSRERCRKISLAARLILLAGAIWIVLIVLRVVPFAPIHIVGAIAAVLGGTVLLGSNASTWNQTDAALAETEARRAELIDALAPHLVELSERRPLH